MRILASQSSVNESNLGIYALGREKGRTRSPFSMAELLHLKNAFLIESLADGSS